MANADHNPSAKERFPEEMLDIDVSSSTKFLVNVTMGLFAMASNNNVIGVANPVPKSARPSLFSVHPREHLDDVWD